MRVSPMFMLAVLAGAIACGGSTAPADPFQAAVGSYALTQVNGNPLPALTSTNVIGYKYYATGGSLVLHADSTFAQTTNVSYLDAGGSNPGGSYVTSAVGTFSMTGSQLSLKFALAIFPGTIGGGTLTYTEAPNTYAYRKQ